MKNRQDRIAGIETRIAALKEEIKELQAERELLVKQNPPPEGNEASGR